MINVEQFDFTPEFEASLLACIVTNPGRFSIYGHVLDAKLFTSVQTTITAKVLFNYMRTRNRTPTWDTMTQLVVDEQRRQMPERDEDAEQRITDFIHRLRDTDTGDVDYYVDRVIKFAKERATIIAIRQTIDDVQNGKTPDGGFARRFEEALQVGQNLDELGYLLHTDAEHVIQTITAVEYGVKTGFSHFDRIWRNGWAPGWLIVPLAPPKRWKTTMALNLALNIVSPQIQAPVFYYSCEISQELAFARSLVNLTGLSFDKIYEDPRAFVDAAQIAITEQVAAPLLFKGFASKTVTIAQIEAHARVSMQQLKCSPKAIIIDYAETVLPGNREASEHQQSASVYTEARAMGHRLKCCVIMPDRCTRETVGQAVPSMLSFQGAFQKGGIVDVAFGLCSTDAEYKQHILRQFVFLNRHGMAYQHFRGKVDPERMRITIDEEIEYNPEDELNGSNRGRRGGSRGGPAPNLPSELRE